MSAVVPSSVAGAPHIVSDQGQSERVLLFVATWLSEPAATALVVEHHGVGERAVLDTVLLRAPAAAALDASSPPSPEAAERPTPEAVMARFGRAIGEHATALPEGDEPRYVVLAQANYGRMLAQCQVWAHPPAPGTRAATGGGAMVTLGQRPPYGMALGGPGSLSPSSSGGARYGSATFATPRPVDAVAALPLDSDGQVEVIKLMSVHIQQLMRNHERTTEASLGAMAALNSTLIERNQLLEAERTKTLELHARLHDQWLDAEKRRHVLEVQEEVQGDIQRAVEAEERAKDQLFEQGFEQLMPALKLVLGQMSGADVVMRIIEELPEGMFESLVQILSPGQRQVLEALGILDAEITEAAKHNDGNDVFDAVVGPEMDRIRKAEARAAAARAEEQAAAAEAAAAEARARAKAVVASASADKPASPPSSPQPATEPPPVALEDEEVPAAGIAGDEEPPPAAQRSPRRVAAPAQATGAEGARETSSVEPTCPPTRRTAMTTFVVRGALPSPTGAGEHRSVDRQFDLPFEAAPSSLAPLPPPSPASAPDAEPEDSS